MVRASIRLPIEEAMLLSVIADQRTAVTFGFHRLREGLDRPVWHRLISFAMKNESRRGTGLDVMIRREISWGHSAGT